VPLFIEELTKSVVESGLVKDVGDRYVGTGPAAPLAVPTTLHASLLARLDRLAPTREVAQTGAALGRSFSHEVISAVAQMPQHKGFEIGAHSVNHPHMGTVDVDTFLQETNESLAFVNQITGKDRSPFAFPFTSDGVSAQSIEYVLRHSKGLGPVFDTQGAPQDGFGFHSRTPADSPDGSASVSNLSTILQL
jgi:hypothetical protein